MKKIFKFLGVLLLLVVVYVGVTTYPKLDIVSGFSAKSVASGHFIDGRSLEIIETGDNDIETVRLATNEINEQGKFVISSAFGLRVSDSIGNPFAIANCLAPSPANITWGVSSMTILAKEIGCLTCLTKATDPQLPSPFMMEASKVGIPSLSGRP